MYLGQLFIAFFRVGLFSMGGGYILIPLIEQEVVSVYGWLTPEEFLEILGITQGIPGAISVKFATYTGFRLAGYPGIIAANLGILLPPVLLMLLLGGLLLRHGQNERIQNLLSGIRFATIGLLISIVVNMSRGHAWDIRSAMLVAVSALLLVFTKIHPAAVVFVAGLYGFWGIK
jgi:chromate transporter